MSKYQEIIKIGEVEFFRRYSNVVPAITISEYGILKQDIQKRGILVSITRSDDGIRHFSDRRSSEWIGIALYRY